MHRFFMQQSSKSEKVCFNLKVLNSFFFHVLLSENLYFINKNNNLESLAHDSNNFDGMISLTFIACFIRLVV